MKITDYSPRAAAMDAHLKGTDLIGIEIGCDTGAHAMALLKYCSVKYLTLVDIWDNPFTMGYCKGRLESAGYKQNIEMIQGISHDVAIKKWIDINFKHVDFIYFDISHDYQTVKQSLEDWWLFLKKDSIAGYRNYSESNHGLKQAVDGFVAEHKIKTVYEKYHNEIILFK